MEGEKEEDNIALPFFFQILIFCILGITMTGSHACLVTNIKKKARQPLWLQHQFVEMTLAPLIRHTQDQTTT